jgi:hypothetical protein
MARSDTRYSVYPAPKAIEVVGNSAPALNQAIECWAALLARAMADNARTFSESYSQFVVGTVYEHCLHEWALVANVFREVRFDPEFANPSELLATAVEDAHRLENVGAEWFASDRDWERKDVDAAVTKLGEKLRRLDYPHAWAVILGVQWFWEHHEEGIDIKKDPWWTLAFRRQWHQAKTKKSPKRRSTREK